MPRLTHALLLKAYSRSPLLPLILRTTRDLPSAINELRWLREHVAETSPESSRRENRRKLLAFCERRERGEPLQYILGSQPFGSLEIKCRKGVLIPRPETEAYTTYLAKLLSQGQLHDVLTAKLNNVKLESRRKLKILDLCSGSGCISLLLFSLISPKLPGLVVTGWDISQTAIALARENLLHNLRRGLLSIPRGSNLQYHHHNVLNPSNSAFKDINVIISNPPYISRSQFYSDTSRSVRIYEPRLALVPGKLQRCFGPGGASQDLETPPWKTVLPQDIFYQQLLNMHSQATDNLVLVMEVGDRMQALRVVTLAMRDSSVRGHNRVEIWRDWPEQAAEEGDEGTVSVDGELIRVVGAGKMRAVVLFRIEAAEGALDALM